METTVLVSLLGFLSSFAAFDSENVPVVETLDSVPVIENGSVRWTYDWYESRLSGKPYDCDIQDSSAGDGPDYVTYFSPSLDTADSFLELISSDADDGYDYGDPLDFPGYFVVSRIRGYCESEFSTDDLVVNERTRTVFHISPEYLDELVLLRGTDSDDPTRVLERTQMMQFIRIEEDSVIIRKWSFKDAGYFYELSPMSPQPVSMFAPASEFEAVAVPGGRDAHTVVAPLCGAG